MNQVWLLYKLLQLLLGICCMSIHVAGSLKFAEPLPHHMIFCGTFTGFVLLSAMRCIRLIAGQRTVLHPELLIVICSMLMHFICGWLSMHYAEGDFHLIYMGAEEELDHVFFLYCKKQSLACIVTGVLYLLQAVLLLDLIVKSPPNEDLKPMVRVTKPPVWDDSLETMTNAERDSLARTSADVYFLGKRVDHWLCQKSKWFRQLAGGQPLKNNRATLERNSRRDTDSISVDIEIHDVPTNAASTVTIRDIEVDSDKAAFGALRSMFSDQFDDEMEEVEEEEGSGSDNYSLR